MTHVDDTGVFWHQLSEAGGDGSFVVEGTERAEYRGAQPDSPMQQIVFRANHAGTVTIVAEEVMMGPPICIPLYVELSMAQCTITINE